MGFLKLDRSGFTKGILQAQGMTSLLGNTISTFLANPLLGVANVAKQAIGGIMNLVTETANAADKFAKLSTATGASIEFLSGLKHAAELSGASFGAVEQSMQRLIKSAGDAASGTGEAKDTFIALGIAVTNADGSLRSTDDLFLESAQALSQITNETQRAAMAQDIFGRSATALVPLLAEGRGGIEAMVAEAKELGLTFDETSAGAAERFNDAMTRMKGAFAGLAQQVAIPIFESLAPVLENLVGTLGSVLGPILQQIGGHMAEFAPVIGELVGSLGEALLPVLSAVFDIFKALLPALKPLFKLLGAVAKLVSTVLAPALKLLAPILEVIAKIIGKIVESIQWVVEKIEGGASWIAEKLGIGGGGGGEGKTEVNVQVSPEDSARRVADKVAPAIAGGVRSVQYRVEESTTRRMALVDFENGMPLR